MRVRMSWMVPGEMFRYSHKTWIYTRMKRASSTQIVPVPLIDHCAHEFNYIACVIITYHIQKHTIACIECNQCFAFQMIHFNRCPTWIFQNVQLVNRPLSSVSFYQINLRRFYWVCEASSLFLSFNVCSATKTPLYDPCGIMRKICMRFLSNKLVPNWTFSYVSNIYYWVGVAEFASEPAYPITFKCKNVDISLAIEKDLMAYMIVIECKVWKIITMLWFTSKPKTTKPSNEIFYREKNEWNKTIQETEKFTFFCLLTKKNERKY